MAEPIEVPFGVRTRVGPRKHLLDGDAHWGHLANTIEPSVCGGDAAFLLSLVMAALRSRCGHYIFALWFLSSFCLFLFLA